MRVAYLAALIIIRPPESRRPRTRPLREPAERAAFQPSGPDLHLGRTQIDMSELARGRNPLAPKPRSAPLLIAHLANQSASTAKNEENNFYYHHNVAPAGLSIRQPASRRQLTLHSDRLYPPARSFDRNPATSGSKSFPGSARIRFLQPATQSGRNKAAPHRPEMSPEPARALLNIATPVDH